MAALRVAPIVEGHGEVPAVRILLERIWREMLGGEYLEVLSPIRQPRNRLEQAEHLLRAVDLACLKLGVDEQRQPLGLVLLLIDLDPSPEPACEAGPRLVETVRTERPHVDFACVLANPEYETCVASAASLFDLPDTAPAPPADPDAARSGKGWVARRFGGRRRYSETADQPALTARMDLRACRERSASFDKLCRELEARADVRN